MSFSSHVVSVCLCAELFFIFKIVPYAMLIAYFFITSINRLNMAIRKLERKHKKPLGVASAAVSSGDDRSPKVLIKNVRAFS